MLYRIYGNGHFACPSNLYCYKVSHTEMNNRDFMGIDRYESGGAGVVFAWIGGNVVT